MMDHENVAEECNSSYIMEACAGSNDCGSSASSSHDREQQEQQQQLLQAMGTQEVHNNPFPSCGSNPLEDEWQPTWAHALPSSGGSESAAGVACVRPPSPDCAELGVQPPPPSPPSA
ncbi:hypothetical protein DQ04_07811040, partial [Trypanosoma grayi]|uniref:hypothetical protein n=1 Tax=Trypanosoma grayi TaxID=71804 RepID=UPI0004F4B0BD